MKIEVAGIISLPEEEDDSVNKSDQCDVVK